LISVISACESSTISIFVKRRTSADGYPL